MPVKPNKSLDTLNRRQHVAKLYLQNWTQSQIAEHRRAEKELLAQPIYLPPEYR